jgi:hypothetical protein
MNPSTLQDCLLEAHKFNAPCMIWGAPGIGKSQIVSQVAKNEEIGLVDIRLSTYDPTDLKGIPANVQGRAVWLQLDELPNVERDGEEGILFLDEINAAPPATTAAAYRLVLDRKIGNYTLPPKWTIFAAGNRESDKGVTYRMPAPLANRFTHFELEVDYNDWCNWALPRVNHNLLSYIRYRPNNLNNFDPSQRAFPTPRMWEQVNKYISVSNDRVRAGLICGAVGEGAGIEFENFLRVAHTLPDPDLILMNPEGAKVPTDLSAVYSTVGALSVRANPLNFDRVLKYAERLDKEFQILLVRDCSKRDPEVTNTKAFELWAMKNTDILI